MLSNQHISKWFFLPFIIPLSYISTPRMSTLRDELFDMVSEQYILSYADRPDCLFDSVHQKLCILIGKQKKDREKKYIQEIISIGIRKKEKIYLRIPK